MHLADAFIQSDLQCIEVIHFYQYVCSLGIEPTTFCAANAMLYHWATGIVTINIFWSEKIHVCKVFRNEKLHGYNKQIHH